MQRNGSTGSANQDKKQAQYHKITKNRMNLRQFYRPNPVPPVLKSPSPTTTNEAPASRGNLSPTLFLPERARGHQQLGRLRVTPFRNADDTYGFTRQLVRPVILPCTVRRRPVLLLPERCYYSCVFIPRRPYRSRSANSCSPTLHCSRRLEVSRIKTEKHHIRHRAIASLESRGPASTPTDPIPIGSRPGHARLPMGSQAGNMTGVSPSNGRRLLSKTLFFTTT